MNKKDIEKLKEWLMEHGYLNYKKKYNEVLERAKKLYEQGTITESLGFVFPELIEIESEKIREEIIAFLRSKNGYMTPNEDWDFHNRWLAWFEKQKPNTHKREIDDAYLQGICDAKQEIEKQGEQSNGIIERRKVYADKVIEWLNDQACLGWIEDVEVDKFINKFKQDFEL